MNFIKYSSAENVEISSLLFSEVFLSCTTQQPHTHTHSIKALTRTEFEDVKADVLFLPMLHYYDTFSLKVRAL